ncbi:MAG: type II secretion system F family protein [Proteobacteria bacterium]|nr:type II secretion system F family protein [Pseudomonadota bacterium]
MNTTALIIVIALIVVLLIGVILLIVSGAFSNKPQANLRSLVAAQRNSSAAIKKENASNLALAAAAESTLTARSRAKTGSMSVERKLKYAKWPITPVQFKMIQAFVTLIIFIPVYLKATLVLDLMVLFIVPGIVGSFLDRAVNKRFEAFDKDYPVMLLSYVSLLKTGMNAIQGLEASAKGLEENSLVRAEVELLIERLRLGLNEEQAINAFGEDINHPELELFVQSLILSRRVGGQLSTTLERLAKQVRRRQQFRKQAVAVVGMERSSSYMIAVIMGLLLGYLAVSSPELILPALTHPMGKKIFQTGVALIICGFYWSKKVTNIKI